MYIMGIYRNLWKENILLNKMGFDHPKYAAKVLMFSHRSDFPPKVPPPHSSPRSPDEIWDIISGRNQSESQNYGEFTGCQKVNLWHWSRPEWIFHEYTKVFTFPRVTNRSRAWRAGQSSCRSCRAISSIIPAALMSEMRFKSANQRQRWGRAANQRTGMCHFLEHWIRWDFRRDCQWPLYADKIKELQGPANEEAGIIRDDQSEARIICNDQSEAAPLPARGSDM